MTTPAAPVSPVRGTSPIRAKFRRFASDRIAMTGVVMFAVVALLCIFARQICAFDPNGIDLTAARQAPNAVHWLGTDQTGRDMLARTLAAGQISLLVGVCSVLIALVIGTVLGALAGYFGGWIDNLVMRLVDVVMTFPTVIVLLTLSAVIGSGTANTIWIIRNFEFSLTTL